MTETPIGLRLREARTKQGISQFTAAVRAGVTLSCWRGWEACAYAPSQANSAAAHEAVGLPAPSPQPERDLNARKTVGRSILAAREGLGLTQAEAAARSGVVNQRRWSDIEAGLAAVDEATLAAVVGAVGLPSE